MFDCSDSDRILKDIEDTKRILADVISTDWDRIADELARAVAPAAITEMGKTTDATEEIEMEKSEKDTETLVDNLANYKDSYIPDDDIRSIWFDNGVTTMLVPVGVVIDKLIDFLIN